MLLVGKWMELEMIILSEISQAQKVKWGSHSFEESGSKMMVILIITKGYECERG
jgi:hypothetical protein